MNIHNEQWSVILNPCSGKRNLKRDWPKIYKKLLDSKIRFEVSTTQYAGHATEIARQLVEKGVRNIMIVGGDGTLNETVNGIYTSNIVDKNAVTIAIFPYGTGNDWARYWGFLENRRRIVDIFLARKRKSIDIGCIESYKDGKLHKHYFLNGAGTGIDADVAHRTNRFKKIFGGHGWVYTLSLVISLLSYRSKPVRVETYHRTIFDGRMFTFAIGNGCFCGGGIRETPSARPDDGLLTGTILNHLNIFSIPRAALNLIAGKIESNPHATCFNESEFTIKFFDKRTLCETDGIEIPIESEFHFKVVPNALQMIVP